MKWTGFAAAAAIMGAVSLLGAAGGRPAQQAEPVWMTDYPAAQSVALQSGKPLFVVFR